MQVGECVLPGDLFNVPVRVDILHQVVKWQRAKARQVRAEACSRDLCVCKPEHRLATSACSLSCQPC